VTSHLRHMLTGSQQLYPSSSSTPTPCVAILSQIYLENQFCLIWPRYLPVVSSEHNLRTLACSKETRWRHDTKTKYSTLTATWMLAKFNTIFFLSNLRVPKKDVLKFPKYANLQVDFQYVYYKTRTS
jgi:hypothetical protein